MGRVTVVGGKVGMEAPVTFDHVFANNTWGQIIEACQKNKVPDTWTVGSQKTMSIDGTDYLIDIIGKNHDTYSDGSGKAPLTFQMHDLYGTTYKINNSDTNVGGWTSCVMRNTNLPSIMSIMPSVVQSGIKAVNKMTSAGNKSATIEITEDKLFLLSEIEIFGAVTFSKSGEGSQYDYYAAGNSKAKSGGNVSRWWQRSPVGSSNTNFCLVKDGGAVDATVPTNRYGVAFAFCF